MDSLFPPGVPVFRFLPLTSMSMEDVAFVVSNVEKKAGKPWIILAIEPSCFNGKGYHRYFRHDGQLGVEMKLIPNDDIPGHWHEMVDISLPFIFSLALDTLTTKKVP